MSVPISSRPFPGSPSTSKLASSSHPSPPSHLFGHPSTLSPPPAPPIFSIGGDTSIEYATLPLPTQCIIYWRSFRPSLPLPLPNPPSYLQAQLDPHGSLPPQPIASTSKLPSPSTSSTWSQVGIQTIEAARRSLVRIARQPRSAANDSSSASSILSSALLAIALPTPPSDPLSKPVDIQHPSPASVDGTASGHGGGDSSGELWVFAISSELDDEEEGQLDSMGQGEPLIKQLKAFSWEGLQESSSGRFNPSNIYPAVPTASSSSSFAAFKLPSSNISPLKPHPHLVPAFPTFLRAVKEAIFEEMTVGDQGGMRHGDGIIIAEPSEAGGDDGGRKGDEWGDCWKVSGFRTVLLLTFTLTVLPNLILLTPHARRIPFFPFPVQPHSSSPPPSLGTNIVLLPLALKAIYVRTSSTSTSESRTGEEQAFWQGLEGRGGRAGKRSRGGDWIVCWVPSASKKAPGLGAGGEGGKEKATGDAASNEEGGTLVSWPASLVLVDSTSTNPTPSSKPTNARFNPPPSATSSSHPIHHKSHRNPVSQSKTFPSLVLDSSRLPGLWTSLTSSSARLSSTPSTQQHQNSVSMNHVDDIALASGVYIETLVREREKEKERVEEERERERRQKEVDEQLAIQALHQPLAGSNKPQMGQQLAPAEENDDLWGSPSPPPAVEQPTTAAVALPVAQQAQPDMMDWSWSGQDYDAGAGGSNSFGLGGNQGEDDTWGGEVDDDDFDFFNSAPLLGNSSFVGTTTDNKSNPADLLSSLEDQPFSLSPLASHLLPPPSAGKHESFSPSLHDDMHFSSPFDIPVFSQSAMTLSHHTSPGGQVAASPASWAHQGRTPKTPKTPFSPFVEIEEDFMEEEEERDAEGAARSASGTARSILPSPGFEAISFGSSHTLADEKYERGKFALPVFEDSVEVDRATRPKGWRGAAGGRKTPQGTAVEASSSKRRKLDRDPSVLLSWTTNLPYTFPPLFPSVHQHPGGGLDPQLRSLYDQLSNPRLGVLQRLKQSSKRKRTTKREISRLPSEFGQRLRITNSGFQRSTGSEVGDEEDRGSDEGDERDGDRLGGRSNLGLPTILGLHLKPESNQHSNHRAPEAEPLVGLDLLSSSYFGVQPSLPSPVVPLPHHYFASSHPTPTPSSAPTPAAAATPAWAPTPTSPPSGSVAKETTAADVEQLADWLAREALENPQIGVELRRSVNKEGEGTIPSFFSGDSEIIRRSLKLVDGSSMDAPRTLASLAVLQGPETTTYPLAVEPLNPPQFSVGHQSTVVKVSPPAIRFWDRIGLEPIGGRKDVLAFALFESSGGSINAKVSNWLERVGAAYESRGLGRHVLGSATSVTGGLLPFGQAGFADTLGTILSELGPSVPHIVVYLVAPRGLKSSTFSLRDIQSQLSSSSRSTSSASDPSSRLIFHTVSLAQVIEDEGSFTSASSLASLERTALAMYDRLPRHVDRLVPRKMFPEDLLQPSVSSISSPAFHIARNKTPEMQFTLTWPPPTLNLLDRHAFLHVGYGISASGEWLLAFVVDERGQAKETKVWRLETRYSFEGVVGRLWAFATAFAKRGDVEWRMVVCKLGLMGWSETAAWDALLTQRIPLHASPLHVFVTCSKLSSTPPFVMEYPALSSTSKPISDLPSQASKSAFFLDVSQLALGLFPNHRRPYAVPSSDDHHLTPSSSSSTSVDEVLALSSFAILNIPPNPSLTASSSSTTSPASLVSSLALHHLLTFASPTSSQIPATSDFRRELARSFHALDVLGRERGTGGTEGMPLHLSGVEGMMEIVEMVKEGAFGL